MLNFNKAFKEIFYPDFYFTLCSSPKDYSRDEEGNVGRFKHNKVLESWVASKKKMAKNELGKETEKVTTNVSMKLPTIAMFVDKVSSAPMYRYRQENSLLKDIELPTEILEFSKENEIFLTISQNMLFSSLEKEGSGKLYEELAERVYQNLTSPLWFFLDNQINLPDYFVDEERGGLCCLDEKMSERTVSYIVASTQLSVTLSAIPTKLVGDNIPAMR